jgi:hypothetical protein
MSVFITSQTFSGFNSLTNASNICQTLANNNPLVVPTGNYLAWLGNDTVNPLTLFSSYNGPYAQVDNLKTAFAYSWAQVISGDSSPHPILVDEFGFSIGVQFSWTGTTSTGESSVNNCLDWASTSMTQVAQAGLNTNPTGWAGDGTTANCGTPGGLHFYCFQQNEFANGCSSNPCVNGATCVDTYDDAYTCLCVQGYSGTNCQTFIDFCAMNPCNTTTGSTCVNGMGSYTCECPHGQVVSNSACASYMGVFVTSTTYPGNTFDPNNPLITANAICQSLANENSNTIIPAVYFAWLSNATGASPSNTFYGYNGPYINTGGQVFANTFISIVNGILTNALNSDESGSQLPNGTQVWTGTLSNGDALVNET